MGDSVIKKDWRAKAVTAVARVFGVQSTYVGTELILSGTGAVQSSLTRLIGRFLGVTYTWSDWKTAHFIERGYMGNAMVYSIVNRITSVAAIPPFKAYRVKSKQKHAKYKAYTSKNATSESLYAASRMKSEVYEEIESHPINALLEKPNRWQSTNEFIQTCIGFKLLTGNRYLYVNVLEIGANAGLPYEILNFPPQHMAVLSRDMFEVTGYKMILGTELTIPKDEIIHSRYWNPYYDGAGSHLIGLSPLRAACKTLERSAMAEERGAKMLKNAGAEGVLYNEEIAVDETTIDYMNALKRKVNETINGVGNAGQIAVANGKLGFIKFGVSAVDLQVIEQEKYSDEKLCNIYKVPAGLFMANANATDNNIAAWNKQLITGAVIPELVDLRDDFNEIAKYYEDDIYVDFDLSFFPELQEDQGKLAETMSKSWWVTPAEKRRIMGYDDDPVEPMLNTYLIPNNLVAIGNTNPEYLNDELDRAIEEGGVGEIPGA